MKPEIILKADVLDILFENRNKDYGAYTLRRDYNGRLLIALALMLGSVLLFMLINFWISQHSFSTDTTETVSPDKEVKLTSIQIPVEPPKAEPVVNKPVATQKWTTPVITKDVVDPLPEIKDLEKDVAIGTETKEGVAASTVSEIPGPVGDGNAPAAPIAPAVEEPAVLHVADVMPAYPGGNEALKRFLLQNLRFEFDDQEPGTRIEIRCRFVVDKEGKVSGVEIIRSAGKKDYDKEVIRVVNKMPEWTPGLQKGSKVAVYFTLPVVVEVPEQ